MEEVQTLEQQDRSLEEPNAESQVDPNEQSSNPDENESNDVNESQEDANTQDDSDESNPAPESKDESQDDESDDDDAMVPLAKLKKVRNEAKNLRDRLKAAEAKVAELEAAKSDEALVKERDDLKAEVERLTNELSAERLRVHLDKAATESGAIEPSVVGKLVDTSKVEWADGTPTNLDALIADLKKSYPKLFAPTQGTGNVGNRSEPRSRDESLQGMSRLAQAYKK